LYPKGITFLPYGKRKRVEFFYLEVCVNFFFDRDKRLCGRDGDGDDGANHANDRMFYQH